MSELEIRELKDRLKKEKDKRIATEEKLSKEQSSKYRSIGFFRQRFNQ